MNGELAQIISLVTHGNLFLSGGNVDLSTNSAFQYVSSVKFVRYKSNQDKQGVEIASSVSDWLSFLCSNKVTRLWNIAFGWQRKDIPEHATDAFSGGVPRAIQADLPNGFELWYPLWKTGGQDKNKPWLVEYRSLMFPNSHALPVQKSSVVKNQLKRAVSQAEKFAKRPDVNASNWADWFYKSLKLLDSSSPTAPFHPDMLPPSGFTLEARQLLASAAQSYVFSSMGSWNDMRFEKPETHKEYEKITKELYDAVKFAIVMASNSFALEELKAAQQSVHPAGGILRGFQAFFKPRKNPDSK
jgi:hypothetical protein